MVDYYALIVSYWIAIGSALVLCRPMASGASSRWLKWQMQGWRGFIVIVSAVIAWPLTIRRNK